MTAVVDAARGPVMRTVHPDTLSERTAEGPSDAALRRLARRTPPPVHGAARGARVPATAGPVTRVAPMHRTTGR